MAFLIACVILSTHSVSAAALSAAVPVSNATTIISDLGDSGNSSIAGVIGITYGISSSWITAGWVPIAIYLLFIFDVLSVVALIVISRNPFAAEELAFQLLDCATWPFRYAVPTNRDRQVQRQRRLPPQSRDESMVRDVLQRIYEMGIL